MLSNLFTLGAFALSSVLAAPAALGPDSNGLYWIESEGIKAAFIPYGASIAALLVKDRWGVERDVIAGFDNATAYATDKGHPHFGGVPGRYANRIKNATFEIDGVKYKVTPNDNPTAAHPEGLNQLHGGPNGWDWRMFTVESYTKDAITFSIVDPDGAEGFPGEVICYVTYSVVPHQWDMKIVAISTTKKTPIHLTIHPYWNLDGFSNNETALVLDHTFHMPYGGLRTGVDGILIPTGDLLANEKGGPNDFWSKPKVLGSSFKDPALVGNCGTGCTGYDNCYLTNRDELQPYDWRVTGPVASLHSPWSGIKVDFYTDADAFQLYSCNFQDGKTPLKASQGLKDNPKFPRTIPKYGCVVMEVQDWIDAINHPEWGRMDKHIYGPGDDAFVIQASHKFSVV